MNYVDALGAFVEALSKYHSTVLVREGRKYDRVLIAGGVRYFVERSTGRIYGARSYIAPNFRWFFGTVYTIDKWEWGDFHGRPISDTSVRAVKQYGPYTHYMEI